MGALIFIIIIVWLVSTISKEATYKTTPLKKVNIPHCTSVDYTVEWYSFQPYTFADFESKYKHTNFYDALVISPPTNEDLLSGEYTDAGMNILALEAEIKTLQNEIDYAESFDRGTKQRRERLAKKTGRLNQLVEDLSACNHLTARKIFTAEKRICGKIEYKDFNIKCPYCSCELSSLTEVCYHCGKALYDQGEV